MNVATDRAIQKISESILWQVMEPLGYIPLAVDWMGRRQGRRLIVSQEEGSIIGWGYLSWIAFGLSF